MERDARCGSAGVDRRRYRRVRLRGTLVQRRRGARSRGSAMAQPRSAPTVRRGSAGDGGDAHHPTPRRGAPGRSPSSSTPSTATAPRSSHRSTFATFTLPARERPALRLDHRPQHVRQRDADADHEHDQHVEDDRPPAAPARTHTERSFDHRRLDPASRPSSSPFHPRHAARAASDCQMTRRAQAGICSARRSGCSPTLCRMYRRDPPGRPPRRLRRRVRGRGTTLATAPAHGGERRSRTSTADASGHRQGHRAAGAPGPKTQPRPAARDPRRIPDGRGRRATRPSDIPRGAGATSCWRTKQEVSDDNVSLVAAGVAFYGLLAVFPGIAALVSIYGLVADPASAGRLFADMPGLPAEARRILGIRPRTSPPRRPRP